MIPSARAVRNYRQVMAEYRRRTRGMTQTEVALAARTTAQAVCDVNKRRRPLNEALVRWLGFELAYVPAAPRPKRATVTEPCEADRTAASPQPVAQAQATTADPPGAGG